MAAPQFTIAEAVDHEFQVHGCEKLRMIVKSFVGNGLISVIAVPRVQRDQHRVDLSQLIVLRNAVILHALFGDVRLVKAIFDDPAIRMERAEVAAAILFQRNSLMGIVVQGNESQALVDALRGDTDLRRERLPNPFATLPHRALGDASGLLFRLLTQAATLSAGDGVLLAYLQGDLELARERILAITDLPTELIPLRQRILADCDDAEEFDNLLDTLRKS